MINNAINIYYFIGSPPSRAVLMLAKALGLKHSLKVINILAGEHLTPEFMKMNPLQTVPTMNDGGFILYDSHAIMKYLVDQYAKDDSLYPRDPKKGALVSQRLFFEATHLFPSLAAHMQSVFRGEGMKQELVEKVEKSLKYLELFLDRQTWVAGQYLSIADYSMITTVSTAEATMIDISKYPNVMSWCSRVKNALADCGYEEINQEGCNAVEGFFKSKLN